jgi:hypothetical protein
MNKMSNEELANVLSDVLGNLSFDDYKIGTLCIDELLSRLSRGQRAIEAMKKILFNYKQWTHGEIKKHDFLEYTEYAIQDYEEEKP